MTKYSPTNATDIDHLARRVAELEAALRQADYLADLAEDVRNDEPLRAAVREYRKDRAALAGDGGGA